jgi:hypothetical protein
MPDSRPPVEGQSTITPIASGRKETRRAGTGLAQAPERDLLLYMQDLIVELEAMAIGAKMEGLADLLGFVSRETERSRKQLS